MGKKIYARCFPIAGKTSQKGVAKDSTKTELNRKVSQFAETLTPEIERGVSLKPENKLN